MDKKRAFEEDLAEIVAGRVFQIVTEDLAKRVADRIIKGIVDSGFDRQLAESPWKVDNI